MKIYDSTNAASKTLENDLRDEITSEDKNNKVTLEEAETRTNSLPDDILTPDT